MQIYKISMKKTFRIEHLFFLCFFNFKKRKKERRIIGVENLDKKTSIYFLITISTEYKNFRYSYIQFKQLISNKLHSYLHIVYKSIPLQNIYFFTSVECLKQALL